MITLRNFFFHILENVGKEIGFTPELLISSTYVLYISLLVMQVGKQNLSSLGIGSALSST